MEHCTITTPKLTEDERRCIGLVAAGAELWDPAFSGARIHIEQDVDAVCCSVDGCDEIAACQLLSAVNSALETLHGAR